MEVLYTDGGKFAEFDGKHFTRDEKTGYYLAASPDAGTKRRKRLHICVWEKCNGEVPKGCHIHHKDHNKNNNELENLECLTAGEHRKRHTEKLTDEQVQRMTQNLIDYAIPEAVKWHKSDSGRAWHSKHAREQWRVREPKVYTCSFCGKEFETLNRYSRTSNHFCSNSCKSAFRRASGVDNEIRRCVICGTEFETNKYSARKRCAKCRHIKH